MGEQYVVNWKLLLEYLRVLLSGPPVCGVVALVFFLAFRDEIRKLIPRIATLKGPAGIELTTQRERSLEASLAPCPCPPPWAPQMPDAPSGLQLEPRDKERLQAFIRSERARATLWEYCFLNLYLVPRTQAVLESFAADLGGANAVTMFDAYWRHRISERAERAAILEALRATALVNIQGDVMELTDKGRKYLRWRGVEAFALEIEDPAPQPTVTPEGERASETVTGGS